MKNFKTKEPQEGEKKSALIQFQKVESKILVVRDQKVILDCDVAELYGVETKRINEAVRNNPEKFPDGYVIDLTSDESSVLRSKFSTLEQAKAKAVIRNILPNHSLRGEDDICSIIETLANT